MPLSDYIEQVFLETVSCSSDDGKVPLTTKSWFILGALLHNCTFTVALTFRTAGLSTRDYNIFTTLASSHELQIIPVKTHRVHYTKYLQFM